MPTKQFTDEQGKALPQSARDAIWANYREAEAAKQRVAQWDAWAHNNKNVLARRSTKASQIAA